MQTLCTYIVLTYYGSHIDPGAEEAEEEEASLEKASSSPLKLAMLYMKKDRSVEQNYRDLKLYLQYV